MMNTTDTMRADILPAVPVGLAVPAEAVPADQHPVATYLASLAPGSRRTMRDALDIVARYLSGGVRDSKTLDWARLRYQHVAAVRSHLAATYSPATGNKIMAALRRVLRECKRLGLMDSGAYQDAIDVDGIKVDTDAPLRGRALKQTELAALCEACSADPTDMGARDGAIFAVLYPCGLRRAEAAALELADYDAATGALTVKHGKGNKRRVVYLTNGALQAVADWLAVRGLEPGPLFYAGTKTGAVVPGAGITAQALWYALDKRRRQAGVAPFSPHDLRRTVISDLLSAGADIATAQRLAGHSNVTTTARYDRRGEETKLAAAGLLHLPYKGRRAGK